MLDVQRVRKESYQWIQNRYKNEKKALRQPEALCDRCGHDYWEQDLGNEPYWRCFNCGNRGRWDGGSFKQRAN